jgi:D-alanyl-D-alanine carboxypeptidase
MTAAARYTWPIGLGLAAALMAQTALAAPVDDAATLAAVDAAAQAALTQHKTVGFTLAIMSHGKMIFEKAYGMANLETGTPATTDTVYRIASINKQFTASEILMLIEHGKIGLEDKLSKYLPDFPRAGDVTIHQLLNHTSGIKDYADGEEFWLRRSRIDSTTGEFVDYLAKQEPLFDFEPGTKFNYSNSGYYLLGAVIEKVTGRLLAEVMAVEVFSKAGMTHTAMDNAADVVPHRASGYEMVGGVAGKFQNAPFISMSTVGANGSMRSTTGDLARWHQELLAGRIVSPASLKLMLTPGRLNNGALASTAKLEDAQSPPSAKPKPDEGTRDYGFGINIERDPQGHVSYPHEGGIPGFRSRLVTYPKDQLTIVFLANIGQGVTNVPKTVTEILLKRLDAPN